MKNNAFGLHGFADKDKITIKEKLESLIYADIPVFLHGKPGCGKSARVKELDPNCTTIELSLAPIEDLAGMDVESEGKVKKIMPQWLCNLQKKCEAEPHKQHILFLDELTNAPESVQTLAYSLVLERKVNHTWNLPKNVRIVLAGNEVDDSSIATEIVEPLKDRMAHLYIEDSHEEWISWAKQHDIHPIIIDFLEKYPEYLRTTCWDSSLGIDKAVTPRTWERASKLLHISKKIWQLECVIGVLLTNEIIYNYSSHVDGSCKGSIEEECIDSFIKADIPVFLHGRPGEGKSSRIKQIDPDCEILELSLLPVEDLSGMLVYEEGKIEKIKPAWLSRLEEKCSEEPDKTHVLFLDELTNAMPRIQSLAYSLILDKTVGNTWKLPENVRIVAAGNSTEDSIAASDMPEPLIDRFAHVEVDTSFEQWMNWAIQNEVHPAIICFLREAEGDFFRSEENDGQIITTPRTWERASNQLKHTPHVKALEPIIGEKLSCEFEEFCLEKTHSKEEILENKINLHDTKYPFAIVPGLLSSSKEEVEKVRAYLEQYLPQTVSLFDELWIAQDKKDIERKRIIELLKEKETLKDNHEKCGRHLSSYILYDNGIIYCLDEYMNAVNPHPDSSSHKKPKLTEMEKGEVIESKWDDLIGKYGKDAVIRPNHTQKSLRKSPGKYEKIKKQHYDSVNR